LDYYELLTLEDELFSNKFLTNQPFLRFLARLGSWPLSFSWKIMNLLENKKIGIFSYFSFFPLGDHFGKKTAWSIIYFLNYAYWEIRPSVLFFSSSSIEDKSYKCIFKQIMLKKFQMAWILEPFKALHFTIHFTLPCIKANFWNINFKKYLTPWYWRLACMGPNKLAYLLLHARHITCRTSNYRHNNSSWAQKTIYNQP